MKSNKLEPGKSRNDLVSIILPVYNVEKYLDECLESVTSQSYRNIEIICVDDGSTDKSSRMCDNWAKKDSRIKVIHKKNEGLNYARRDGFKYSNGKWICFVDSDDIIDNDYVKSLLQAALDTKTDMALCKLSWFYKKSDIERDKQKDTEKIIFEKNHSEVIKKSIAGWGNAWMMVAHSRIINSTLFNKFDWEFSNYRINEDEFESPQWYKKAKNGIAFIDKTLYFYRQNNHNSLRQVDNANTFNGKKITKFELLYEIYRKKQKLFGNKYEKLLLRQLAIDFFWHMNIYIKEGKLSDSDIVAIKEKIIPLAGRIINFKKLPMHIKQGFKLLKEQNFFGYSLLIIEDLRKQNSNKDEINNLQTSEIEQLKAEIHAITNSRSWKITKPLRMIKSLLNR
jgi:glycosyltransferase involved in cell wall biosynthesis